jgi:hypothetical protein
MYRLSAGLLILVLLIGCRTKKTSIFSDQDVSEKCRSIVQNFECWFNGDTMKWLKETQWELVSNRHKDMVIEAMAKCQSHYSSDFVRVFVLGYMDSGYAFPRIARFKNSQDPLTRDQVAESLSLEGKYKEPGIRILVELLFDPDKNVRTGVACSISRRLDDDDSLPLLLLHYFENIYQRPVTLPDAISGTATDWVRALAASKYRGTLVPWLEDIKEKFNYDPVTMWMNYEPPQKWASWWDDARAEQSQALVEGKQITQEMRKKYQQVIQKAKLRTKLMIFVDFFE